MLIQTFLLKVINNKRKNLTDHEIIDRIAEHLGWYAKHQNGGIIRTYGGQSYHLLIHVSSLTFVL